MANEKYINNITLEYLLNPALYERLNCINNNEQVILEDIQLYRKRICQLTKDMTKGSYINDNIKKSFINYADTLIYHLKHIDEKDILQSDYDNLDICDSSNNICDSSNNICDSEESKNFNDILMNKPLTNNLDAFVVKTNTKTINNFIPQQKLVNTKNSK